MKNLLARILCSAASTMWQKEPTLGNYTSETHQHELNLAFQYACELHGWFPWLDCDFDVSKRSCNFERPDIILHRRGTHDLNFLVIEIKRKRSRKAVPADLKQIRERWFENYFRYRFGAAVILEDAKPEFEVQVLSRQEKDDPPIILSHRDLKWPLTRPEFGDVRYQALLKSVDRLLAIKECDRLVDPSIPESELDQMLYALYR